MSGGHIKLNLKEFKHVKSDKDSTTLQHKLGHQLVLAHNSLSPEAKTQLQALSGMSKAAETPLQADERRDHKAEGGYIPRANKTPPPREYGDPNPPPQPEKQSAKEQLKDYGSAAVGSSKPGWWAEGGKVDKVAKYCMYCGGMAHGGECMASGGAVESGSPDMNMAEGGNVEPKQGNKEPKLDYNQIRKEKREMNNKEANKPIIRKKYAEGEEVAADDSAPSGATGEWQDAPPESLVEKAGELTGKYVIPAMHDYAHKKFIDPVMAAGTLAKRGVEDFGKGFEAGDRHAHGLPPPESDMPQMQAAQNAAQQDQSSQGQPQVQPPAPVQPQAPQQQMGFEQEYNQGLQNRIQAERDMAAAKGQMGDQQAEALKNVIDARQQAAQQYHQSFKALDDERMAHIHDIQMGHIDPNKYWDDHSKVASGIGMILAGFNPSDKPNAAVDFLKHQMDNNLKAQEKNLDSQQNLLAANLHQFGNLRDASEMTRMMQNDAVANQLQMSAAKAQSPMAKAAALGAAGQLQQEASQMHQNFAMRHAMMNLANGGGSSAATEQMMNFMDATNPGSAKQYRERYVPGYTGANGGAFASTEVPESVRKELNAKDTLGHAASDLRQWAQTHSTIVPGTADYNVGQQKALALQALAREAMLNTVYREGEQPLLDKVVKSNPAGILKEVNSLPKLDELMKYNDMTRSELAAHHGLKPMGQSHQTDQSSQGEVKTMGGVKYKKVSGGWQKVK